MKFIWGFEFSEGNAEQISGNFTTQKIDRKERWEQRFFWSTENTPTIKLAGFAHHHCWLKSYKLGHHTDTYLFVGDKRNVKLRKNKLHSKGLTQSDNDNVCFAAKKKWDLVSQLDAISLELAMEFQPPISVDNIKQAILAKYPHALVEKEVLIYPLNPSGHDRIEFSRLQISGKCYLSLSIEMAEKQAVINLKKAMRIDKPALTYMNFLQGLTC